MKKLFKSLITPFGDIHNRSLVVIIVLELVFFLASWQMFKPILIPGPGEVGNSLLAFLSDSDFYTNIISSLVLTFKAMFFSIIIASVISYGYVMPILRPISKFLIKFRYLSMIGLLFVFMLLFKNGDSIKMSALMFGIIPFFASSLLTSIDKIKQEEMDMCRTLKYTRWQELYELIIFGRAETLLEAVRLNFAMAWMMITMVESLSMSSGGIGVLLYKYNKYNQLEPIFALQIIIFALGVAFDYALSKIRYATFPHVRYAELKK